MLGVTVEVNGIEKHTYKDWGLKWYGVDISAPEPQTYYIQVPGMNGKLDLSEALTGDIQYDNRTVKLVFETDGNYFSWLSISSKIYNFLHGRIAKLTLDIDPAFYYQGRITLSSTKEDYLTGELVLVADVEPYKLDANSSLEPWKWDTFSFVDGVIREYKDLNVENNLQVKIPVTREISQLVIESSSEMICKFNGTDYTIKQGSYRYLDIKLTEGENILHFIGNGIISIDYQGRSL